MEDLHFKGEASIKNLDFNENTPQNDADSLALRSKTSLRMIYEAQARLIRQRLGGLNEVRQMLGLSQRKMCQLLLVDPSAWSRWLKDESKVPPHVWRSLLWYIELENKRPEWAQWREFVLARTAAEPGSKSDSNVAEELNEKLRELSKEYQELKELYASDLLRLREIEDQLKNNDLKHQSIGLGWKVLLLINSILVFAYLFRALF